MSDLIIGEPDVIRKEDNILWLRAEIERLQKTMRDTQSETVERLETALTIMFTKANGILPDGAMCRAIAKAALAALETDDE